MKYLVQETETGEIILKKGIHYFTEQEEKQHIASGFQPVNDVGFYINLTPVPVPTLEEIKERKISTLKAQRDTLEVEDITVDGNTFDYDEKRGSVSIMLSSPYRLLVLLFIGLLQTISPQKSQQKTSSRSSLR